MKHFDHCQCSKCRSQRPQPRPAPCGYLMQQIVSEGTIREQCRQYSLSLSPLPRILVPPYSVREVRVSGEITLAPDCCGDVTATVPLAVVICDQQGNSHTAAASLTLCIPMRCAGSLSAQQYTAQAQISLCSQPVCFQDPANVPLCLSVCIRAFGVAVQAMYAPTPCVPDCPQLPLYPPPCRCPHI